MSNSARIVVRGEGGQNWHILEAGGAFSWTALCGAGEGNLPYHMRSAVLGEDGPYFISFPNQKVPLDLCPSCKERMSWA